ncbi:MAG: extracellular solute-binding protein, partial [Chloroflexi bacterium]|nr:extracellular solute-binding protein [Chloroflexota bacterium]
MSTSGGCVSRRSFLRGVAIGGGLLALRGLLQAPAATPAAAAAGQSGSISYMAVAEPISDYIRQEMIPPFTSATGIDVQIDTTDYTKLHDKQVLELQGSNYDVFQVDQVWLQSYVKSGFLEPLDTYLATGVAKTDSFFPSVLHARQLTGSQWVLPLSPIPVDYYSRKDVLDAAGLAPADTWDDLLNIAQKTMTKDASGNVTRWGFSTRGEQGNPITWTWLPMLWAFGGQVFDDKMEPVYNDETGVASVEYFKELNQTSAPGWHSAQDVAAAMQQDQATQTTLMSVYNAAMDDPSASKVVGKVEFGEMPTKVKRATMLGLWTLGLNASSSKKDLGYQFIDYLSQPDNARKMALAGVVGATQPAIYQDPQAPRFFPVLGKVLAYASPPPLIPEAD